MARWLTAVPFIVLGVAAAGCGGGGGTSSPTAQGGISTPGPTSSTVDLAQQITARLRKAGYVVHETHLPRPFIRGPIDQAALAHGPQQTFVALSSGDDKTYTQLQSELTRVTAEQRARAIANKPMTDAAVQRLATLHTNLQDVTRREFTVYVFNSADDATTYVAQFDEQNKHILSLPGTGDVNQYKTVGSVVYFVDALEDSGKIKFDQSGFDKLVSIAQGA